MPPRKEKATTAEPDPDHVATRARNVNVHPGIRAKDALRVNRPQEEIQREKDAREVKKLAKQQQEQMEDIVADEIAEFENQVALAAAQADIQFPTHQIDTLDDSPPKLKKIESQSKKSASTMREDQTTNVGLINLKAITKGKKRKTAQAEVIADNNDVSHAEEAIMKPAKKAKAAMNDDAQTQPKRPIPRPTGKAALSNQIKTASEVARGVEKVAGASRLPKKRPSANSQYRDSSDKESSEDDEPEESSTWQMKKAKVAVENRMTLPLRRTESMIESEPEPEPEYNHTSNTLNDTDKESEDDNFPTPRVNKRDNRNYYIPTQSEQSLGSEEEGSKFNSPMQKIVKQKGKARARAQTQVDSVKDKERGKKGKEVMRDRVQAMRMAPGVMVQALPSSNSNSFKTPVGNRSIKKNADTMRAPPAGAFNNDVVVSKVVSHKAVASKVLAKKSKASKLVKSSEVIELSGSDLELPPAIGGMGDEDECAEAQLARSSPIKPSTRQQPQDFVVTKQEPVQSARTSATHSSSSGRSRKVWKIEDLPAGSNTRNEWQSIIVPNFINFVLAGDQPWTSDDKILIPVLQQIWLKTHRRENTFEIRANTAPWALANQKLCEYCARLGTKALGVLSTFFITQKGQGSLGNIKIMKSFATKLLKKCRFVYKDGEIKRQNAFRHVLIVETLSAQFSSLTTTNAEPLKGLKIDEPRCALALTVVAVERALALWKNEDVELATIQGRVMVTVKKKQDSNKSSRDFSSAYWEENTSEYLQCIRGLDKVIFQDILNEAFSLAKRIGNRRLLLPSNGCIGGKSIRSSLLDPIAGSSDSDTDDSASDNAGMGDEGEGEAEAGEAEAVEAELEQLDESG